jgi:nucleoside 2-deoxyribosyltransferase
MNEATDTLKRIGRIRVLYLAGPLFGAAEQIHNLLLAKALEKLGWIVILPQRISEECLDLNGDIDYDALAERCHSFATAYSTIVVANLDGPDPDSGTAWEVSAALEKKGIAVLYRTDFRTDLKRDLGINTMFRCHDPAIIYYPARLTSLRDINSFYSSLAEKISKAVIDQENKMFERERR